MAVAKWGEDRRTDGIDLDRVIVDPDYRRRVMARLRAEAALRPQPQDPAPIAGQDD